MRKRLSIAVFVALTLGLGVYGFVRCGSARSTKSASVAVNEEPQGSVTDPPGAGATDPSPSTRSDSAAPAGPTIDRKRREEMRQAIYRAWGLAPPQADFAGATPPPKPAIPEERPFDKDYVRSRIREDYLPLAKDCYEQGLKKNPKLEGKLTASFRIVGNKNVGGIIDWVDTSDGTTLDDKDVVECLKQSLYSVSFQAPPNDGVVTVKYPLTFAPDPPDGAT